MDGAGRLARSLRSLGPQADLKAAALGAVVLLRERLGLRTRVPPRPVIDREPSNRLILLLERNLPNRTGIALTVLMLLGSAVLGVVKGGHIDDLVAALSDTRNALANSAGFRITTVAINGRKQLSQDAVLEPYMSRRFISLPLVVGKGADTRARDFLALLDRYPQVRAVTKVVIFVGERRWNLRLKDGLDIRLPENDVGNALATLSKLDKEERLLSRDIVAVDMRLPDRLTVQLSEDAGKARDELFKDKKTKKKAGDA